MYTDGDLQCLDTWLAQESFKLQLGASLPMATAFLGLKAMLTRQVTGISIVEFLSRGQNNGCDVLILVSTVTKDMHQCMTINNLAAWTGPGHVFVTITRISGAGSWGYVTRLAGASHLDIGVEAWQLSLFQLILCVDGQDAGVPHKRDYQQAVELIRERVTQAPHALDTCRALSAMCKWAPGNGVSACPSLRVSFWGGSVGLTPMSVHYQGGTAVIPLSMKTGFGSEQSGAKLRSSSQGLHTSGHGTMRFESTTNVLAKRMLKYYRIL